MKTILLLQIDLKFRMDHTIQNYLDKRPFIRPLSTVTPSEDLKMIVVIPAFREDQLFEALDSLLNASPLDYRVEIIPILNYPDNSDGLDQEFHQQQYEELVGKYGHQTKGNIVVLPILPIPLPEKSAGVGLVRQIGMNEAARRFSLVGNSNGIIVNFDADCVCNPDYFKEIDAYYQSANAKPCLSIGFEHPLDHLNETSKSAIVDYELHLRYYIQAQKWIRYPFAYHTLGSCFAITVSEYCRQGGMNQRKAGEDFYFMHKFSIHEQLGEIKKPLVYPSSRESLRVPFGTGKAITDYLNQGIQMSYALQAILEFGDLFNSANEYLKLSELDMELYWLNKSPVAWECIKKQGVVSEILQLKKNTSDNKSLMDRYQKWLNPFRLMKFLHELRDLSYSDLEVGQCARELLMLKGLDVSEIQSNEELLKVFRKLDYGIH